MDAFSGHKKELEKERNIRNKIKSRNQTRGSSKSYARCTCYEESSQKKSSQFIKLCFS